jgi:glycosyltransferase involved in cell wall biosynthesis
MQTVDTVPETVSFVVPAFNCCETLDEAVRSCFWQTRQPEEVIIVDDGSTDETAQLMQHLAEEFGPRVILSHQTHAGASACRNHGIRRASGEFLFYLDADDLAPPERVAQSLAELDEQYADFVYGQKEYFKTGDWMTRTEPTTVVLPTPQNVCGAGFATSTGAVRRSLHLEVGVWFDEVMAGGEDADLLISTLSAGAVAYCSTNTYNWMRRGRLSLSNRVDWLTMHQYMLWKHGEFIEEFSGGGKVFMDTRTRQRVVRELEGTGSTRLTVW